MPQITIHGNVSGQVNVAGQSIDTPALNLSMDEVVSDIDASNALQSEKAEAKSKLQQLRSHPFVKNLWHDPVWSKVIAGAILALFGILFSYWIVQSTPAASKHPDGAPLAPAVTQAQIWPPITLGMLKNLTYQIEGEYITLQDGKREFNPDSGQGIHGKAIFAHFVDHAFGDLDGDGSSDAIAVLQVTDGGSGIYYYLSTVYNDHGSPTVVGPAFVLGDRLEFRSISILKGKVTAQLMMHKPGDGLCCPSLFRTLEFIIRDKALLCTTAPCTEI